VIHRNWVEGTRCDNCGKVYKRYLIPKLCKKCGVELYSQDLIQSLLGTITFTKYVKEVAIRRRGLFKWEIKEVE